MTTKKKSTPAPKPAKQSTISPAPTRPTRPVRRLTKAETEALDRSAADIIRALVNEYAGPELKTQVPSLCAEILANTARPMTPEEMREAVVTLIAEGDRWPSRESVLAALYRPSAKSETEIVEKEARHEKRESLRRHLATAWAAMRCKVVDGDWSAANIPGELHVAAQRWA